MEKSLYEIPPLLFRLSLCPKKTVRSSVRSKLTILMIFCASWFVPVCFYHIFFSPCSGFAPENIINVLQGQRIGTLFHKDAHEWAQVKEVDAREMAVAARECSRRLQVSSHL